MPVPIKSIFDASAPNNSGVDYSFLAHYMENPKPSKKKLITASNKDAELLFKLWYEADKKDNETFAIDASMKARDISRLKSKGFITGNKEEVKITKKGKIVITTMVLSEPNNFEKKKQKKTYNEILASMDKRGKKGYRIPKFASNNSNNLRLD